MGVRSPFPCVNRKALDLSVLWVTVPHLPHPTAGVVGDCPPICPPVGDGPANLQHPSCSQAGNRAGNRHSDGQGPNPAKQAWIRQGSSPSGCRTRRFPARLHRAKLPDYCLEMIPHVVLGTRLTSLKALGFSSNSIFALRGKPAPGLT